MGFEIEDFPLKVKQQQQNISIKFSPLDLELELITNFSVNKTFSEAYNDGLVSVVDNNTFLRWNVISF